MSTREKALHILDLLSEEQPEAFVTLFGGIEETEDEMFCQKPAKDYLNDPDPHKHDSVELSELAKELGINLNEL